MNGAFTTRTPRPMRSQAIGMRLASRGITAYFVASSIIRPLISDIPNCIDGAF
jgi:hypothetical protein